MSDHSSEVAPTGAAAIIAESGAIASNSFIPGPRGSGGGRTSPNLARDRTRSSSMEDIYVSESVPEEVATEGPSNGAAVGSSNSKGNAVTGNASSSSSESSSDMGGEDGATVGSPSVYEVAVEEHRAQLVAELTTFEAKRREGLQTEIASTKLHWKAVTRLLDLAMVEDIQLLFFLRGKLDAVRAYATAMGALPSLGAPQVANGGKGRRRSGSFSSASASSVSTASSSSSPSLSLSTSSSSTAGNANALKILNGAATSKERWQLLAPHARPAVTSQVHVAAAYHAFADTVGMLVVRTETSLKAATDFVGELKGRGQRALAVLEGVAPRAEEAYAAFSSAAEKAANIERALAEGQLNNASLSIGTAATVAREERVLSEWRYPCLWLEDAKYRAIVTACRWTFVECESLLGDLFSRAHDAERTRRQATTELLSELLEKEAALWAGLPAELAEATALLRTYAKRNGNVAEVAVDVRQTLGELVEQIKQEEVQAALEAAKKSKQPSKQEQPLPQPPGPTDSTAANGEAASEADAAAVTAAAGGAAMMGAAADSGSEGPAHRKEMETPLRSPFVLHAEVLERRKEGSVYGGTWVVCLAVVTCDRHLHLFDLPKGMTIDSSCPSAIEALEPKRPTELIQPPDQKAASMDPGGPSGQPPSSPQLPPRPPLSVTTASAANASTKAAAKFMESLGHDTVLVPVATVRLSKATCAWRPAEGKSNKPAKNARLDAAFTVEETYLVSGARSLFSTEDTRKVVLRTASQEKMVDWCVLIKGASK